MQVIPAVDLMGADMVRLEQGDYERVTLRRSPVEYIAELVADDPPLIHLVDLDGARSGRVRLDAVRRVLDAAGSIPVQVAGGIRDVQTALSVIEMGAFRVVIGTAAFSDRAVLNAIVAELGDRIVVAVDVRNGHVAVSGWLEQTAFTVDEALGRCRDAGVVRILGTAIDRDGTLAGPDRDLMATFCASGLRVLAAGGIRDADDLALLATMGCEGAIVGRALAEKVRTAAVEAR